ncbi:MAG: hypothetical protein ABIJ08_06825 [Nanoarchaeota archaeon]
MTFDIRKKVPLNKGKYDLRRQDIKLKSELGEIITKHKIAYLHLRREHKKDYLGQVFPFGKLPNNVKSFLEKNWFSIDAFRFKSRNFKFLNLQLFEIKLRSYYPNLRKEGYIIDMTKKELSIYKMARTLGFEVYVVTIWLYDDWKYDLKLNNFDNAKIKIAEGSKKFLKNILRI